MIAYFWEREDAAAVAERIGGEVRRGRFLGEDDDEDHPWIVVVEGADPAELDRLLSAHGGWLETEDDGSPPAPLPLPDAPKRFKK